MRPIVAIVSALESTRIPIVSMEFRLFLWEKKRGNIYPIGKFIETIGNFYKGRGTQWCDKHNV